jgi:hypothetical protein
MIADSFYSLADLWVQRLSEVTSRHAVVARLALRSC